MTMDILTMDTGRAYPPRESEFTRPFWQALSQGRWTTTGCKACGRMTFPPKSVCPHCWSPEVEWRALETRGTLYSWTRIHAAPAVFAAEAPYAVGIVDLDCGIRLGCRLVETAGVDLRPSLPVEMLVLAYRDGPLFAARVRPGG